MTVRSGWASIVIGIAGVCVAMSAGCTRAASVPATSNASVRPAAPAAVALSVVSVSEALDRGGVGALKSKFGEPSTLTGVFDLATGETGGGSLDLGSGKSYVYDWALDSAGKPVVASHRIQLESGSLTAQDLDFAHRFRDGVSLLGT